MKLSLEQVQKIAKLAKLRLTSAEEEKFQKQVSDILDYVEILKEVDTTNTLPTSQVTGLSNSTRSEIDSDLHPISNPDALLNCSSLQKELHQIKVPNVL